MKRIAAIVIAIALIGGVLFVVTRDETTGETVKLEEDSLEVGPVGSVSEGAIEPEVSPGRLFVDERFPSLPPEDEMVKMDAQLEKKPDHRFYRLDDGRSVMVESLHASNKLHREEAEPISDLETLESIFILYRWAFKENPEGGSNREITEALIGNNPHQLVFVSPDHPSLNAEGELTDRWGEPYKFHKISDQVMDVISSGPDRRLWSHDDLELGYTEDFNDASVAADN
ncbi:MAG: hypothetical protein AAGA58_12595 [Verrucomicrobiota bacterium]